MNESIASVNQQTFTAKSKVLSGQEGSAYLDKRATVMPFKEALCGVLQRDVSLNTAFKPTF